MSVQKANTLYKDALKNTKIL